MKSIYNKCIKRLTDVVLAAVGLIVLLIPILIIAAAIKLDSPGPVFFRQERVGRHKKNFSILKFRTMYVDAPSDMPTHLLEDPDALITRTGRILRKTSLDELPQLVNILCGTMSIVGPRPALWNQYDLIQARDEIHDASGNTINDIRPGLTGWAQINGRDELSIEEKAALDGHYLNHMSLWMDLRCMIGTVLAVVRQDGIVEGKQYGCDK